MTARIVVVEDEPAIRMFVTRNLARRGHEVSSFGTVGTALPLVRRGDLDLLLVDVELPDGCGLDLIGALPEGDDVPVIVMSALNEERDFGRGFAAGAADYIAKPFSADELLARVSRHIGAREKRRTARVDRANERPLAFDRYRIERALGRGGYGKVFLARDTGRQGERVALKVLDARPSEEADARSRFIRETLALARVNHPNVVRVLDVGQGEGRVYFSMEYVGDQTLERRVLEQGPLAESEAQALTQGLLDALVTLRASGIVHRDLKPSNIMLRENDPRQPVLIDFGLSRSDGDAKQTQSGVALGTPAYMAPEVIRGKTADERSDLFSLGLTIRFALTGADPFEESTVGSLMRRMVAEPIPLAELALSPPFAIFLGWLLEKKPSSRPATADAALRSIEAIRRARRAALPDTESVLRPTMLAAWGNASSSSKTSSSSTAPSSSD
jgi:serine/threonine protein kinase/CheY-like chemotaxis protein